MALLAQAAMGQKSMEPLLRTFKPPASAGHDSSLVFFKRAVAAIPAQPTAAIQSLNPNLTTYCSRLLSGYASRKCIGR